eukprot:3179917-Heterocapsa_arctica.AAC.1
MVTAPSWSASPSSTSSNVQKSSRLVRSRAIPASTLAVSRGRPVTVSNHGGPVTVINMTSRASFAAPR